MEGLARILVLFSILLCNIKYTHGLTCYACAGCSGTWNATAMTQQNCTDSTYSCAKVGGTVAGVSSFTYGCLANCVATNTGGILSSLVSAGTWCCTSNLCNASISQMKSTAFSSILGLILPIILALSF